MQREALLARTFVELADTSFEHFDVSELLTLLSNRCVEALGVSAAALLLITPEGDSQVAASSSEALRLVELFALKSETDLCLDRHRTGESGPVLDKDREALYKDRKAIDCRWPHFAPGLRSVHTVPIGLRGQVIGALHLFRGDVGAMEEADILAAQALADVAAIAIIQHRAYLQAQVVNEQLTSALNSRVVIEQAKGVLAERTGLDVERAFSELRNYARRHNLRLADIARGVVDGTMTATALKRSRRLPTASDPSRPAFVARPASRSPSPAAQRALASASPSRFLAPPVSSRKGDG